MKKVISLFLMAALCMGLAAPVWAADSTTSYQSDFVTISHVVSYEENWDGGGPGLPVTCIAPVEIVTTKELTSFFVVNDDNGQALEILNKIPALHSEHEGHEEFIDAGAKVILTEPGNYLLDAYLCTDTHDSGNGGSGIYESIYITVLDDTANDDSPANETHFSDVSDSDYYADAVDWAVSEGITTGTTDTTFSPDSTCTTAQILTFLWRANGSPAPAGSNAAVPAGQYYSDAVNWAYENGLISGSTFNAAAPCTRSATVTYLWKLAGSPAATTATFTDVAADAEYAQAVAWAVAEGITTGSTATTFSPDTTCTRGQIATFLYRAFA